MKRAKRMLLCGLAVIIGGSALGIVGCHKDTETRRTTVKVERPEHERKVTVEKKEHH